MPPELDPAYDRFARPMRRETPTEGIKRIERDLRSADIEQPERSNTQPGRFVAGAGRNLEGYNANIGTQGPLSGGLIAAGDPDTGRPVMVGGRAQAGPLSYQVTQPTFKGAPASHQVSIGGQPFDADAYFGLSAKQGPDGRSYGVSAGGDGWNAYGGYNPTTKGVNVGGEYRANFADGWNAYGGYNPTTKGVNVGGEYRANFADGGKVTAGGPVTATPAQRKAGNYTKLHESVQSLRIAIENPKGSTRVREHSGKSKMAADYGQIIGTRKDNDKMNVDTYVGPHKDSKKVFIVNQQHPDTKKFNEHKVMLGYKDRSHAMRDYVHSFSDGQGHKRVASIVEMDAHELKDWLKKGNLHKPVHGG